MDKIICLVGESGSGKSTMAELLENERYNYIQSYTTRTPRCQNERGHIFVNMEHYKLDFNSKKMIAETYFHNQFYWIVREQYQNKGTSIYIIEPNGVKDLKENVKDAEIIAIYLKVDEHLRYERMLNRSNSLETFRQRCDARAEINKRMYMDKKRFEIVRCDYVVDGNRNPEDILHDIKSIIEGM